MESCENLFIPSASIFQIIYNDGSVLLQNYKKSLHSAFEC